MAEPSGSSDRSGDPAGAGPRPGSETRPSLLWFLAALVLPPLFLVARIRVRDGDKLPSSGPFILVPNHLSNIDPLVVGGVVWHQGRAPRFLAKASLFRVPVVGVLLRAIGQIPVERGGRMQRGAIPLDAAGRLIREGQGVIVYPEGSLTRDPRLWPMRGKSGAARLALQLGIPVIPVAHWGTQGLMPVNTTKLTLRPRPHIELLFGDPVDLSDLGAGTDGVTLQAATDRIMAAITALLAELRDEPAPAERWDPVKHGQPETGLF